MWGCFSTHSTPSKSATAQEWILDFLRGAKPSSGYLKLGVQPPRSYTAKLFGSIMFRFDDYLKGVIAK